MRPSSAAATRSFAPSPMPAASRIAFGITTRPARSTETSSAIDDPYATMAYQHMYGRMVIIFGSRTRVRRHGLPARKTTPFTLLPNRRSIEGLEGRQRQVADTAFRLENGGEGDIVVREREQGPDTALLRSD